MTFIFNKNISLIFFILITTISCKSDNNLQLYSERAFAEENKNNLNPTSSGNIEPQKFSIFSGEESSEIIFDKNGLELIIELDFKEMLFSTKSINKIEYLEINLLVNSTPVNLKIQKKNTDKNLVHKIIIKGVLPKIEASIQIEAFDNKSNSIGLTKTDKTIDFSGNKNLNIKLNILDEISKNPFKKNHETSENANGNVNSSNGKNK